MKCLAVSLILLSIFHTIGKAEEVKTKDSTITHPEQYIKITDWSFFVAFGGIPIIHHVTIENKSDIAYKSVKVRLDYYLTSYPYASKEIGGKTVILPIILPPHSKEIYLEEGFVLGAVSSRIYAGSIEVLGAVPVTKEDEKSGYPKLIL